MTAEPTLKGPHQLRGNGLWETTEFNSRLQPTQIGLGSGAAAQNKLKLNYTYGTAANNGNVLSQTITVPTAGASPSFTATQTYTYDSLNRLAQATEAIPNQTGWNQTFSYDRFGNRNYVEAPTTTLPKLCNGGTTVCPQDVPKVNPSVNTGNNRLNGYAFDAAGNTTTDADGRTFVYDAENKQTKATAGGTTLGEYFYDGDGKRVKKIGLDPGGQPELTVFVYDAGGKLIGEYSTIVQTGTAAKTIYTTNDHLGSPRVNTDATGQVVSRHDYHPFGEEIDRTGYGSDTIRKTFTGYERDDETGLDFAEARMLSSPLGRFGTPDPYNVILEKERGADEDERSQIFIAFVSNPQRWNLYVYVINNPLAFTDPDGREPRTINLFLSLANEEGMKDWEKFAKEARAKGYTVNIFTKGTATAAKFLESMKAKDTVTIFSGHSLSIDEGKTRLGIQFSGGQGVGNSQVQPKLSHTADGVDIQNDVVAVFSCGFGKGFDNLTSSNGAAFVSIVQGDGNPTTMIDSVDRAARNFFESITEVPVNSLGRDFSSARNHRLDRASGRANTGLSEMGYAPVNEGDVVSYRILPRAKRR